MAREEPEIKLPTSVGSSKKHESSRKTSISALLTMPKSLTMKKAIEIIHKLFRDSLVVKTGLENFEHYLLACEMSAIVR